jgi:inward rectifier potassium channel
MDEYSPFYKMSLNDIKNSDFLLILMMSGVDENLHDMIHQQHEYTQHDMLWGARFTPMLSWDSHHKFIDLDFDKLSQTVAAPISSLPDVAVIDMEESNLSDRVVAADEDTQVYQTLTNVAGEDEEIDLNRLHHEGAASGTRQSENGDEADSISNADLELSTLERQQSGSSTHTNSGSEDDGLKNSQSQHHRIRFDQRSRTNSFRVHQLLSSHLARPGHSHGITHDMSNQPLSLARSRIRFKNHPLLRVFSNGVYYQALEMTWSFLFILLIFVYLAVIAIVALLLYLYPGDVLLETDNLEVHHDYMRMFFFCAQTITTIGYGILSPLPNNIFVNFFVFVLVIIGVCISTLLTGITWAKFSIPKASTLLYSDNLLLTSFHGHRALMFRVANNRTFGLIIEGSFRVSVVVLNRQLARKETHELKLIRNVWPIVQLGNTVTHIIDEESPLYKLSVDQILDGDIFFVVLFTGLDSVVGENMFSRKTYHSCDILVGHHFADNIKLAMDGLHFDLNAINETVLTPEEDLRKTQLYADRVSEAFKDESDENNSVEDERFTKVNSRTSLFVRSTGTSSFGNGSVNADDNDCDDTGIPPIDEIGWSTPKITKYTDIMSPIDSYFSRI